LLEKHLNDYVSKNSFDYFIHKDLGGFLSRELDFYIKNEVLYLDDINTKQSDFFIAQLSKVKAIKVVAGKVIDFLAQIENFQKKLWLKKKFVIRTDYCITLDKIPSTYYPEILANKAQLQEWKILFDVDIQNAEQLVFEQFLVLDTKFFEDSFKDRLIAEFDNLDATTNGLLINSENFQALTLLQESHFKNVDVTYIDPPYNTDATPILYKNEYKESTWLSLLYDRLLLAENLFQPDDGALSVAIDDAEIDVLKRLLKQTLTNHEIHKVIVNHYPGSGTGRSNVSRTHEYNLFAIPTDSDTLRGNLKADGVRERNFRRAGTGDNNYRVGRPNSFFAVLVDPVTLSVLDVEEPPKDNNYPRGNTSNGLKRIYPIGSDGSERVWSLSYEGAKKAIAEKMLYCTSSFTINRLYNDEGARDLVQSIWTNNKFNATVHGTNLLTDLFNNSGLFSYPKSVFTVKSAIDVISHSNKNSLILDFFSGSGTTGHATIKLNREGGDRKYILVEMGTYFNTVTKPRIQKVIYSDSWKNGKPQDKQGISQLVKYQVLESYEDTLNNLYLDSKTELDFSGKAKEEYMLQYMLELESREHLFNLEMFRKPFDYHLKVTENNELKPTKVDLVETFNYLIGLHVSKVQRVKDIKVVEGTTRTGFNTLVIWRDLETTTHDEVEKLLGRFYDSQRTKEFQQIYINGDHHLENLRTEGDSFKIKGIEETFFKKMFNEIEL
jgi:adenine-specific DNA-methyltransferase